MTLARLLWLLCILLLTLLSGCTTFSSYQQGEAQIEEWIKAKQYGRALESLANIDPTDPNYSAAARKRKHVEALVASYEHEIRMKTSRLQNDGKWAEALNTYDDATDRLPNSAILKDGLARLHREQTKELDRLELKRLLGYSNWLKQVIPIFDDIVRVDPRNSDAKSRRNKIHNEAESLADELTQYGNRAMANDQLERAEQLLNLAGELSDAPAIKESLKNLKQQKIVTARYQKALALKQRHITDKLIKQFNESYRKRNFEQAREHLNALAGTAYSRDRLATLENKLQRALDQEAARLVREGMNAYSRGQYEAAVNNWKQVLVLQPSNKQARESLKRAERVLKNLEDIRSKQGGE